MGDATLGTPGSGCQSSIHLSTDNITVCDSQLKHFYSLEQMGKKTSGSLMKSQHAVACVQKTFEGEVNYNIYGANNKKTTSNHRA